MHILLLNNADPLIKDNEGYNAITWGNILNQPNFIYFFNFYISIQASAYKDIEELFNNHDSKLIKNNKVTLLEGKYN